MIIYSSVSSVFKWEVQIGMAAPCNWLNLRHSERVIAEVTLIGDRLLGRISALVWRMRRSMIRYWPMHERYVSALQIFLRVRQQIQ